MSFSTTKEIGDYGECRAVTYLRLRGYTVKERNWRAGKNEIDIIAATWRDLVFVEVKTRSYSPEELADAHPPAHAVDAEKQFHTRAAAKQYLITHPSNKRPRMDVIEIYLDKPAPGKKPKVIRIRHIKAAY